jgi:hypothetical protein
MSHEDPLLDELRGTTPDPDRKAIVRLGSLVRAVTPPAPLSDAGPLVRLRLAEAPPEHAIDRFYNQGRCDDPGLAALARAVATAGIPPRPCDLAAGVLSAIREPARSSRRMATPGSVTLDNDGRRRVWWWVCVGHLAAALVLVVLRPAALADPVTDPETVSDPATPTATPIRPSSWDDSGSSLLTTRSRMVTRSALAESHGLGRALPVVRGSVAWLVAQQRVGGPDDGRMVPADLGADRALAVQAFATLALLGEGLDDHEREIAIHRSMAWIARQPPTRDPQALTAVAWCRVEASLLAGDPEWRQLAQRDLAALPGNLSGPAAAAALLALETANAGGLDVPRRMLESFRRQIGKPLPKDDDPTLLGLTALTRMILGLRGLSSTGEALDRLDRIPTSAPADPLAWIAPSLALREAGGERWDRWVQGRLMPLVQRFEPVGSDRWVMPAEAVRWAQDAGGPVAATAWAVLCLQAPYRTVPLAGSGR